MGMFDSIQIKKKIECPDCHKYMNYPNTEVIDFQTKDLYQMLYVWEIGDKIIMDKSGLKLKFVAEGNDVLNGFGICFHCKKGVEADIIIEKGIIKDIRNFRVYKVE